MPLSETQISLPDQLTDELIIYKFCYTSILDYEAFRALKHPDSPNEGYIFGLMSLDPQHQPIVYFCHTQSHPHAESILKQLHPDQIFHTRLQLQYTLSGINRINLEWSLPHQVTLPDHIINTLINRISPTCLDLNGVNIHIGGQLSYSYALQSQHLHQY